MKHVLNTETYKMNQLTFSIVTTNNYKVKNQKVI